MKIVTLQSVSVARLKIAAFGKITYSVTCIVALFSRITEFFPKPTMKRVKALGTDARPCNYFSPQQRTVRAIL